jgi:O-antigen ligase
MTRSIIIFSVIYIIANAIFIANEFYLLNLLPLALLLAYLLFFKFESYIFILIASLPISVPLRYIVKGLDFDISLPAEVLIIIATAFFILNILYKNQFDKRIILHPVSIAIYINIAWMFITSVTSTMPLVSFKFLASRIWFVTIFYVILLIIFAEYKKFYTYIWTYAIPFIIVIAYFSMRLVNEGIGNVVSTANQSCRPFFPDHTSYAAAMAMILPVLAFIIYIRRKANFLQKLFFISISVIFFLGLIFSYTRAAWLSLIVALGFMMLTVFKIRLKYSLGIAVVSGVILALSWTQIEIALSSNKQDSNDNLLKHVQSVSNVSTDASNLERLNRWNSALRMFKEKPVLGFGPGTYMFKYAPFQATAEKTVISTNAGTLGNAHSEYLGPLAESGILGSLSFIAIVLTSLFTASRVYFNANRRKVRLLALALMTGLLSYCIHGIMNNFLDLDKLNALFWGFIAMIVALDIYHSNYKGKPESLLNY